MALTYDRMRTDLYEAGSMRKIRVSRAGYSSLMVIGFSSVAINPKVIAEPDFPESTVVTRREARRPRPIYIIPGRAGGAALLFGPPGATDLLPANAPWFRAWQGGTYGHEFFKRKWLDVSKLSLDDLEWHASPTVVRSDTPYSHEMMDFPWLNNGSRQAEFDLWANLSLGQGVHSIIVSPAIGAAGFSCTMPASRAFPAGVHVYWNGHILAHSALSPVGVANNAPRFFPKCYVTDANIGIAGQQETLMTTQDQVGWTFSPDNPDPMFLAGAFARFGPVFDSVTTALGLPTATMGSTYPFAAASTLIGYAYGLPHEGGPIMWELGSIAADGAGVTCAVTWASMDLTAADYRKLYPLASLPSAEAAQVSDALLSLEDSVWFRTAYVPSGVTYQLPLEETVFYKDMQRAEGTMDEILFDSLEDGRPPMSYATLHARSLVEISKGRHRYFTVALTQDGNEGVSTVPLLFRKVDGVVECWQGAEFQLTSGDALIALRAGSTYSTEAPLTLDQVAVEFFLLSTWAAVMNTSELASEGRLYLIDENQNSNDLRFNWGNDEISRGLPLLLGFSTHQMSVTVGGLTLGVLAPEAT